MGHRLCKKNKTRLHGSCASFSHTVVETQVSSKKGLCVQQREVNDAAMVLIQCIKPACSCSNKVCCTSKGATAKKNPDVCTNIRILKKKKCSSWKGVPHLRRQLASNVSK